MAVSPSRAGRDLDEQDIRLLHGVPQFHRLLDGGVGILGQPGVDLDRHPPVQAVGPLARMCEDAAGGSYVVGGDGEDGVLDARTFGGQPAELLGVAVSTGQRGGEDRGVRGDPDDIPVGDQFLQLAAGQQLAGQVVEPDRHPGGGQVGERVGMRWNGTC